MAKKPEPPTEDKEDDANLWDGVAGSVRPLEGREFLAGSAPAADATEAAQQLMNEKKSKSGKAKKAIKKKLQPTTPPPPVPPKVPLPELSFDNQPGLDKSTARRMAKGNVKIEARLDLHGMTQDEAKPALENFIENAYRAAKREVIVVTGKGAKADGQIGVLRSMAPRWLNLEPNRSRVVAFSHAAPKDGGQGALYIRIRKKKP